MAQEDSASSDEARAGEIIVTAQRRAERLENVPMSVTALSAVTLEKTGVTGLQEIGRISPGVQINFAGAFTQPAIRGVTTLTNGVAGENNIAVYVDGFYVPDSLSINTDLVNLAGIEILKGPQGTLYGRNATGGAILINTLAPSDHLTGKVQLEYGRFNDISVRGYVSAPLSDTVRISLAGSNRYSDGYLKLANPNKIGGRVGNAAPLRNQSLRMKLQADLSDSLTATLGLNYGLTSDARGNIYTPREYRTASVPPPPQTAPIDDLRTVSFNYPSIVRARTLESTLTIEHRSDFGTLTSRTSYGLRNFTGGFDFDGGYRDLGYSFGQQKTRTFQQSVDYAISAIEGLDLIIGGLYYEDHFRPRGSKYTSLSFGPGLALLTGALTEFDTESYAVYADATLHLTDQLSINVGGRYSHDKKSVLEFVENLAPGAAVQYSLPPVAKDASFSKFTPRASIRFELAPRTNVYASYSAGYRSGSFNPNPVTRADLLIPIRPETIKAYEIGFKTAQDGFRAEIAGFYYDYRNYNVAINTVNPLTQSVSTIVGNAPKATIKGVDAQITITPVERTNLTVSAAYIRARYGSFANATGTGVNAATGLNVASQQQDWTGQQMSRAPDFTANANIDHTFDLLDGKLLTAASVTYSDSYVISNPSLFGPLAAPELRTKQRFRQGKTTIVNAQITWTDANDQFSVGIWGKNLTNEKYRATYNGTVLYGDYSVAAPPATYGVRLGYNF